MTSSDEGLTWSPPKNLSHIEAPLHAGEPVWIQRTAGGGGNGIRIKGGAHAGRLVVPGYHEYPPAPGARDADDKEEEEGEHATLNTAADDAEACTKARGISIATEWCNDVAKGPGCSAKPGPLVALDSGSKARATERMWRCYSPSSLTKDGQAYNASTASSQYCTYNAAIASIVASCKYPAPPPPAPAYTGSYSYVMISDDDGESYRFSESFFQGSAEGSVAEVAGEDRLLYIARRSTKTACTNPATTRHCAGSMTSTDGGDTWSDQVDVGQLPDPGCKNTVASWQSSRTGKDVLVHGGSHSDVSRTNVSAKVSTDGGRSWGGEVMVWEAPLVGGYTAVQAWDETVAVVFENKTCSISIGIIN